MPAGKLPPQAELLICQMGPRGLLGGLMERGGPAMLPLGSACMSGLRKRFQNFGRTSRRQVTRTLGV